MITNIRNLKFFQLKSFKDILDILQFAIKFLFLCELNMIKKTLPADIFASYADLLVEVLNVNYPKVVLI